MNVEFAPAAVVAVALSFFISFQAEDVAAGDVYKWVDENGKVHFGDKPQAEDAQVIEVKPSAPPAAGARQRHERTQRVLEAMTAEREEREHASQAAREEATRRKRKCGLARAELNRRQTSAHLFYRDEEGNKRVIEGAEYDAAIQEARNAVTEWCS
ncbi:MAG: DUF4124 domain-containing protein [Proteobacteria bacterium]|nr:DUF4124 domain-containing protein [Pseudomonadota bacterium]MCZ6892994.1 DUF4124 domain-containing protein [Gammaproteobacteria bacterium]